MTMTAAAADLLDAGRILLETLAVHDRIADSFRSDDFPPTEAPECAAALLCGVAAYVGVVASSAGFRERDAERVVRHCDRALDLLSSAGRDGVGLDDAPGTVAGVVAGIQRSLPRGDLARIVDGVVGLARVIAASPAPGGRPIQEAAEVVGLLADAMENGRDSASGVVCDPAFASAMRRFLQQSVALVEAFIPAGGPLADEAMRDVRSLLNANAALLTDTMARNAEAASAAAAAGAVTCAAAAEALARTRTATPSVRTRCVAALRRAVFLAGSALPCACSISPLNAAIDSPDDDLISALATAAADLARSASAGLAPAMRSRLAALLGDCADGVDTSTTLYSGTDASAREVYEETLVAKMRYAEALAREVAASAG